MDVARSRQLSDWIGFVCFSTLAFITLSRISAVTLLLMPTISFELLIAISFLIREPPRAAVRTMRARLTAYSGTFLILAFVQMARQFQPGWLFPTQSDTLRATGALFWLTGFVWTTYSVWYLRHAFSIEPQARRLVTSGPYGVARHPVYTGYSLQYIGMWFLYPTTVFGGVLIGWLLLTAGRIQLEEQVLSRTFPEYVDYRRRVAPLGAVRFRRPARA
jgi:protein-S-isoprenylcysteine O-methyltransferase Ste14